MHSSLKKFIITAALLLWGCSPNAESPLQEPTVTETDPVQVTAEVNGESPDWINLRVSFQAHEGRVLDLAFSAEGEYLASSGQDLDINLWDPATGLKVHSFPMNLVDMSDIDISQHGNLLASGEAIWDLESKQEVLTLKRGSALPVFVAFSPDSGTLALAPLDQETHLWDLITGKPFYSFPEMEEKRTKRMEFSPDGTLLAEGVIDGSIRIWNVIRGELVRTLHYGGETDIHDIGFSPDGKYLASVGRVPWVIIWDLSNGQAIQKFRTRDNMYGVSISADSRIVAASAGAEKAVLLWSLETGDRVDSLPLSEQSMAVTFSPDGRWLAAGTFDGKIFLWEISPPE